jgi:hypothetical protein
MGKVVAGATVSLDGYIAGPNESGFEHLFAWFAGGDFEFPSLNPDVQFRLTEPDYRYLRDVVKGIGVYVVGRRLFDLTDGWGTQFRPSSLPAIRSGGSRPASR